MNGKERQLLRLLDPFGGSGVEKYFQFDTGYWDKMLRQKGESFWMEQGAKRALRLFRAAAENIPAYRDFLRKKRFNHQQVRSIKDFDSIPLTDQHNYIDAYSLEKRCWKGQLTSAKIVSVSSGTSGDPKLWPRHGYQEFEAAIIHELIYRYVLKLNSASTLMIVCFPMGVYVSGVATILPSWMAANRMSNLSLVSAGNNKVEVLKIVRKLQSSYDQLVLIGHPFFIKDIIETGQGEGINWKLSKVKLMFCSEGFNETWRSHLLKQIGAESFPAIINTYGSSELLLIGHETLASINLRAILEKNEEVREKLAASKLTPNLFQYNPFLRYVESINEELVFTSASGVPLIRFNLHDSGRIFTYAQGSEILRKKEFGKKKEEWQLPFVALKGRSDHTIVFYAANIYPEHIHSALNHPDLLSKLTGRFRMRKDYLKNLDQFLEINVELRPGVKVQSRLASVIQKKIVMQLKEINMEYLFLCNNLDKNLIPRIRLWPHQHEKYFKPGLKPRYI